MTGGTIGFVGGWTCLQSSSSVWVGGHNGGLGHPHSAAVDAFSCRRSVQYLSRPVVAVPLRNRPFTFVKASALETEAVNVSTPELFNKPISPVPPFPKTSFLVRSARVDELDNVTDVRCKSFYSYLAEDRYLYFQRKREIKEVVLGRWRNPSAYCLVAVDPETCELVGTCDATMHDPPRRKSFMFFSQDGGTDGKKIYVSSMAVRPDARRRGVAKALLGKVIDVGTKLGVTEVYLHVEWENKPAVWLYQGCGFERYAQLPPKWLRGMSRPEHTLMVKKLT